MSKPLYMQVSDLQDRLNRAYDQIRYRDEELATVKQALAVLRDNHATEIRCLREEIELERSAYLQRDKDCKAAEQRAEKAEADLKDIREKARAYLDHVESCCSCYGYAGRALEEALIQQ